MWKLNGENLKSISLKSGMKNGCPQSPPLFNKVVEFQGRATWQEGNKRDSNREGKKSN
jgi:hypothetical protein